MTSERSKRRDFLSLIFIAKSISKKLLIIIIIIIIIITSISIISNLLGLNGKYAWLRP